MLWTMVNGLLSMDYGDGLFLEKKIMICRYSFQQSVITKYLSHDSCTLGM